MSINVGVLGATGYTGVQLISILHNHPEVRIKWITSEKYAGRKISDSFTHFRNKFDILCSSVGDIGKLGKVDLVFSCLPQGVSMNFIKRFYDNGIKVVDLSPDMRFGDREIYGRVFGMQHRCPELLEKCVYGLPEINRKEIRNSLIVSNPGCYSTSVLVPLIPFFGMKDIFEKKLIIDIKSAISGAGRSPRPQFHFPETNLNAGADNISGHAQKFEIQNIMRDRSLDKFDCIFSTHLIPLNRGIIATIYLKMSHSGMKPGEIHGEFRNTFDSELFVRIRYPEKLPALNDVCGSNYLDIGFEIQDDSLIIVSALDNLLKGASGQAVQNMNIMFGLPEAAGLKEVPCFV